MAMAVKEESSSSRSPLSSPSPSPPRSPQKFEFLPHPKYTPRTMRRKQNPPRRKAAKSLRFPSDPESEDLPPEATKSQDDKNTSATTSDYGTLSLHNLVEVDSVLSNSLSNMSLMIDDEKRSQNTRTEILRINSEAFVLYPTPIVYNLRSSLCVNLIHEDVSLPTSTLSQISEAIEVTKYNLTEPAIYCMNCKHKRVFIFKRLFKKFIHTETVKVQRNLLVFKIDSAGTYVVFKSRKEPVIDYVHLNPRKATNFRITKDPNDPIIEVIFDKGCVESRMRLKGQVFFEELHWEQEYLASPIISLSPHGAMFDKEVQIRIEIFKISEAGDFSDRDLKLYVDRRNFENTWSLIDDFKLVTDENGRKFVEFQVRHFSLFKVVWEGVKKGTGLISTLFGRSTAHAESFPMKCQASMDEYENNHFGLEVCVFRAEKSFPEVMNYNHIVGKSLSKNVKCGRKLTIILKSNLFRADTEAGEQEEMIKDENDFKGQDFSRDFALVFNENIQQRTGPFGKVFVCSCDTNGTQETIFEFNIQKSGNEAERRDTASGASNVADQWATVPLEELAINFGVIDDDNWKNLAKHLGFTRAEMKRFKTSGAPFKAILDAFRARGGEARDFVDKMLVTCRNSRVGPGAQGITGSPMTSSPSPGRVSQSASSGLGSSRHSQNLLYQRHHASSSSSSSDASDNENLASGSGSNVLMDPPPEYPEQRPLKRKRHKGGKHRSKKRKRRRSRSTSSNSSSSSTPSSDHRTKNSSHNSKVSDKSLRLDNRKLSETFLWELTEFLTNSHWKALGRTLQVEESQLTAIATQHTGGNRELYYQMLLTWKEKYPKKFTFGTLYCALMKENHCAVAKKMDSIYRKQEIR